MKEKKVIDLGDLKEETLQGDFPFLEGDEGREIEESREDGESPPFEFPDEEALEDKPPFMVEGAPEAPKAVDPGVEDKISSLEEKLAQLDSTLANVRKLDEETEEKINKIEKSLEEMLHLYELVTNEVNPFVDVPEKKVRREVPKEGDKSPIEIEKSLFKEEMKFEEKELHLDKINNEPTFLMLMMKWLDFLLKKAGYRGMIKALLYYEELGWISEDVRNKMIKYAEEIKINGAPSGKRSLSIKDHIVSLFFISKLQGIKVSPSVYSAVLDELEELGLQE